jgi:hypothetical protein
MISYEKLIADLIPLLAALGIAAAFTIASMTEADAAVRWEINGEKGEACYNASAAWALFKAAQEPAGITSAKVTIPPATDPFVVRCVAENAARRKTAGQPS